MNGFMFSPPSKEEPVQVIRNLTVRRLNSGGLGVFVGDERLAGLVHVAIIDDGERCVLSAQFAMQYVTLDTEKANTDNMN